MWIISSALLRDCENSRCSPGQAAEYSADTCLDGEPSAPLSGPHILRLYLPHDKMTDFSRLSRFGVMCKPLTANHGADVLMWYLEGFPARILAQPEKAQESMANAPACGRTWQGLLARYNPLLSLWRTPQCLLFGEWEQSLEIWPRWGLMRSGECWELAIWERPIFGKGCGLWDTPCKGDAHPRAYNRNKPYHGPGQKHLQAQAYERMTQHCVDGGKLNPMWVEWLMGWPMGWTGLQPLETDKFREWQQQHFLNFTGE